MADTDRRWRVLTCVRTGTGRTDWATHEVALLPPHTPFADAITRATDEYWKLITNHPDLIYTMYVEVQECWVADNGGLIEFYTAWQAGATCITTTSGDEYQAEWPPAPYEV